MTLFMLPSLPEGDKHHQFDAEELAHRPDGSQLLFESPIQQHQAVHGELQRGRCNLNASDGRTSRITVCLSKHVGWTQRLKNWVYSGIYCVCTLVCLYQLWNVVDYDQVGPGVSEAEVGFIINPTQLTDPADGAGNDTWSINVSHHTLQCVFSVCSLVT